MLDNETIEFMKSLGEAMDKIAFKIGFFYPLT